MVKERNTSVGFSNYLVAYYIIDEGSSLRSSDIEASLRESLPDYMIPTAFQQMSTLPLTRNGKLDKKSLPQVTFETQENHYQAPQTPLEDSLVSVWSELLNIDRVGINDDFFRIF